MRKLKALKIVDRIFDEAGGDAVIVQDAFKYALENSTDGRVDLNLVLERIRAALVAEKAGE